MSPLIFGFSRSNGNTPNTPRPLIERISSPSTDFDSRATDSDVSMSSTSETTDRRRVADTSRARGFSDWYTSLGYLFVESQRHSAFRSPGFHCGIFPRGGDEFISERGDRVDMPRPFQSRDKFEVDLLNKYEQPSFNNLGRDINLEIGQLVVKTYSDVHDHGRTVNVDPNGPFIIIDRTDTHYVLMKRDGSIYPNLVAADAVYPYLSTWHVVDLPRDLVIHREVQQVMETTRRD